MGVGTRKRVVLQLNPKVTADVTAWTDSELHKTEFDLRDKWVARLKEYSKTFEVKS